MRRRLTLALCALAVSLLSCDGGGGDPDAGGIDPARADFTRRMLASLGANVIVPALDGFVTASAGLEAATAAYAADPSPDNRAAAQAAWRDAMGAWQLVEVMQLGPAGMSGASGVVGGMDLRDEVYTYESRSTCRIDQETVAGEYADVDVFAAELVNVRGLDALEYLLFEESPGNTCSVMSPINTDGSWDALGADGVRDARAAYAATLAVLVAREAAALAATWAPADGDFLSTLSNAGLDGNDFPSAQAALNDLAGAMLYLDTDTRDMKLAEPAGIAVCMEATCPDALETPRAAYGAASILVNLRAFERLYLGGDPGTDALGWDDLLVETDNAALAAELTAALATAVTATEALGPSLQDAIANDAPAVMAAYDAISEVLRLFKMDAFTWLDVEPSGPRIGDND